MSPAPFRLMTWQLVEPGVAWMSETPDSASSFCSSPSGERLGKPIPSSLIVTLSA